MSAPPGLTLALARRAVEARFDALPTEVREEGVRAFVNWVGVALAGSREPAVAAAARFVGAQGGAPQASLIGHGARTDAPRAAFVNCVASAVLAYDDAHLPTVAHPSGPAAAAVFAVAQARGVSGEQFLNALVLGIEVQCRIANMLVLPPAPMNTALYVNGFSGPIGVAAAVGRLIGLDETRMAWALGLAASQASGFRSTHGTMTAHFRPGHATRVGLEAALLAEQGFDCTLDALEASGGFIDVFAPGSDPARALEGWGSTWEMLENRYKPYPCGIVIHPVIDACQDIFDRLPPGAQLGEIMLTVNPLVLRLTGKRAPRDALESHVSVYHWAACTLLGAAAGLAATEERALADPAIAALRERIEATPDETLGKGEAKARAVLADGTVLESHVTKARGSRDRPMTNAELDAKFIDLASRVVSPDAAEELCSACRSVGSMADVGSEIGALLP